MRFIVADWGTTRFRAYLVEDETIVDRVASDEGVSALESGRAPGGVPQPLRPWLAAEPSAPVAARRHGRQPRRWVEAPYAACPAGAEDIAARHDRRSISATDGAAISCRASCCEPAPGAVDVMRGEETLVLGTGVADGLVCLPGTHPKWVEMKGGRVERFATYFTGEMYALLRHHSMVGRPATEPEDPAGFDLGLEAAERNGGAAGQRVGLLHLIFGARAAAVTGRLPAAALGPYLSGLLTGDEINGAFSLFASRRR